MDERHERPMSTPPHAPMAAEAGTTSSRSVQPASKDVHSENDVSLLQLVNALLRRWRLVIGLPIAASFSAGTISLIIPPSFTASTAFVPEVASQGSLPSGVAGLASQFGISVGTEGSQSPQFYAAIVKSQQIMDSVLLSPYPDPRSSRNPPDSTTLLRILGVEGDGLADSLHRGRQELENLVSVRVDNATSIVTLTVDSRYPPLAAAVANGFVVHLNEFNAKTRQSKARERRRFVETRLAETEQQLQHAEEAIKQFYERNRTWQQSPQLVFEHEQLQRKVQLRQEVFLTLRREYETARIAEVNDTPVITIIYPAISPQEKSKPKRKLLVLLAFLLGGIVAVLYAVGAEYVARDQDEYVRFRQLLAQTRHDLRALVRTSRK